MNRRRAIHGSEHPGTDELPLIDLSKEEDFTLGPVLVQPSLSSIVGEQASVHVEYRVMQVLVLLHRSLGRSVSREEILSSCWGYSGSDESINRSISRLRQIFRILAIAPAVSITTIPKIGYALFLSGDGE